MKDFAQLVMKVGGSTKTNEKLSALREYFSQASDADKVWTIAIFTGRRPKRFVNARQLATWCLELVELPEWLFEESYHTVGDLGETIALLIGKTAINPDATAGRLDANIMQEQSSLAAMIESFISLMKADESIRRSFVEQHWASMDYETCFVFNKLITGGFRIGVSQKMMVNALNRATGIPSEIVAHRISGNWDPSTTFFNDLMSEDGALLDNSKPYPFYLAYQLDDPVESLGEAGKWQAEWKWDGIRGQIIKRGDEIFVWSRGEELMTDKFPEYQLLLNALPNGTVLDGEIVAIQEQETNLETAVELVEEWQQNILQQAPAPFALLQTRIGRKNVSKKQLKDAPVGFIAYDLLEWEGNDMRSIPLHTRRKILEQVIEGIKLPGVQLSPAIAFESWEQLAALREKSRDLFSEGVMLKRKDSIYQVGRKVGDWWKWKIDPLTIDAVMVYAQKGHGRRSNLYTDYTFAVKDGDKLVTFTKAYSGLTDKEFAQVDAFVKRNSLEKFGPVRTVKPQLVFEIAFEGIAASNRHKSGVALRFPRISKWRTDKRAEEINTLDDLKQMLKAYGK